MTRIDLTRIMGQRKALFLVSTLSILIMVALAWYDAYIELLPGMSTDTRRFHNNGAEIARYGYNYEFYMGAEFYDQLLGIFYRITGISEFYGNLLSVFVSALSIWIFVLCLETLGAEEGMVLAVFLFAFDPTFLLHGAVTLREAYELFFFILGVFLVARSIQSDSLSATTFNIAGFGLCLILLACFHSRALCFLSLCLLIAAACIHLAIRRSYWQKMIVLATLFAFAWLLWNSSAGEYVQGKLFPDDNGRKSVFNSVSMYRDSISSRDPRTQYPFTLETKDVLSVLWSAVLVHLQYLFYPLVVKLTDYKDLVPVSASFARLALILYIATGMLRLRTNRKMITTSLLLMGLFVLTSGLWALGSSNYGQGFRHHIMTNWLLVLAAAIVFNAGREVHTHAR